MSDCKECERKDRQIRILAEGSDNYRFDAELWKKHHFHMTKIFRNIYEISRDAMYYPSNYKEREACDALDKEYVAADIASHKFVGYTK